MEEAWVNRWSGKTLLESEFEQRFKNIYIYIKLCTYHNVFLNEQNVNFWICSDLNTIVFPCSKTEQSNSNFTLCYYHSSL